MTYRTKKQAFICLALMSIFGAGYLAAQEQHSSLAQQLHWMSTAEVNKLNPEIRPPVSPFCPGTYFNAELAKPTPYNEQSAVEISADSSELTEDGVSVFSGNIKIIQGNRLMTATEATLDQATRQAELTGPLSIESPEATFIGEHATIKLDEQYLSIENARYAINDAHAMGTASNITKHKNGTLTIDDGSYTLCPPTDKTWSISGSQIIIDEEKGWGEATHLKLDIYDIPVFYFPYATFPIDDRRKSGFLVPAFGNTSNGGLYVAVPYYVNLAPNYDLLVSPRYISERGTLLSGDFSYLMGKGQKETGHGSLLGSWLPRDSLQDNDARKAASWQHQGNPRAHWYTYADINYVSDNDYLSDFSSGIGAVRDVDIIRLGYVQYVSGAFTAMVRGSGYQIVSTEITGADIPYQEVPYIGTQYQIEESGWNYGLKAELVNFERSTSIVDDPTGLRARLIPMLGYTYDKDWFYLKPQAQARYLNYQLNNKQDPANNINQIIPIYSLDSGLFFDRPIKFGNNNYTQTLEPRLKYLNIPYYDQDDQPLFDDKYTSISYDQFFVDNRFVGGDRLSNTEQITAGITSRLLTEQTRQEYLRLRIGQIFFFEDREVELYQSGLGEPPPPLTTSQSLITSDLAYRASQNWRIYSQWNWEPQQQNTESLTFRLNYQDTGWNTWNVSYTDLSDSDLSSPSGKAAKQVELSFIKPFSNNRWTLLGGWLFDLDEHQSMETIGGLEYESCCWAVRLAASRSMQNANDGSDTLVAEQRFLFQFELKGLAGLGSNMENTLSEQINGYERRGKALDDL